MDKIRKKVKSEQTEPQNNLQEVEVSNLENAPEPEINLQEQMLAMQAKMQEFQKILNEQQARNQMLEQENEHLKQLSSPTLNDEQVAVLLAKKQKKEQKIAMCQKIVEYRKNCIVFFEEVVSFATDRINGTNVSNNCSGLNSIAAEAGMPQICLKVEVFGTSTRNPESGDKPYFVKSFNFGNTPEMCVKVFETFIERSLPKLKEAETELEFAKNINITLTNE